jgi:hypothetical protein
MKNNVFGMIRERNRLFIAEEDAKIWNKWNVITMETEA